MRVSLASTLKRAMTLTASTNDKSGRSFSDDLTEHGSSGGQHGSSATGCCFRGMWSVLHLNQYTT